MTMIIHIGAPKTATSTLQNAFFPAHKGLMFLGKEVDGTRVHKGWRVPHVGDVMQQVEVGDIDFRPDRGAVSGLVTDLLRNAGDRPIVISDEGLCMFSGVDALTKLRRLTDLFQG